MYLITYEKRNGDIFCRLRNSIPECGIGKETSMGWKVVDVKSYFKGGYYSIPKCKLLEKKQRKINKIRINLLDFFKKNINLFALLILIFFSLK